VIPVSSATAAERAERILKVRKYPLAAYGLALLMVALAVLVRGLVGYIGENPKTVRLALPPPCPRARKEIIVPGDSGTRPRRIDHELIRALARARSWMGMLQRGEFADTAEIAQRHGLSEPHVRRLLRFAYLAPDIVEAIVEGRQPRTLTVKLLLQGIPLDWSDQHAAFGLR